MLRAVVLLSLLIASVAGAAAPRQVARKTFAAADQYVIFEFLDDNLLHFEMGKGAPPVAGAAGIETSPMVAQHDFAGPESFRATGAGLGVLETSHMLVDVDATSLCFMVHDKVRRMILTTVCPWNLHNDWKGLTVRTSGAENVYGTGQQFGMPGSADGDWLGKWRGGGPQGNQMVPFSGGAVGNTQFPIMYALGRGNETYGLFMDDVYKLNWDFTADPWRVETWGSQLRGYIIAGADLPSVRRTYMGLTGHPLVPPKKMFGLWMSTYGYRNWQQVRDELATLRAAKFPVDGFVLDLFWFGGVASSGALNDGMGGEDSRMGALTWDLEHFPNPAETMRSLREQEGVGIIPIEESYIAYKLPEFQKAAQGHHLVTMCKDGSPAAMVHNGGFHDEAHPKDTWFWGRGGMLDWSNPETRRWWHTLKRQPLLDAGVLGMWTDLGEPEIFNLDGCYHGLGGTYPSPGHEADVHNAFSLLWHQGIYEGMAAAKSDKRPYMMSRSGTSGMQRYGGTMWSGDIGSNAASLATHYNAQMHMSLSGMDYFGADVGGFHRSGLDGDVNELFTQWFADASLLDVPTRPHTMNVSQTLTTNPAKIGDAASNLANIRQRYELSPYLYSLAHVAYRTGDPVFPPLVYYFQDDPMVRQMGHEKMLGPSLLGAIVARHGETSRDVYLPRGTWVDVHSLVWTDSTGAWLRGVPTVRDGHFVLPLYARAGAIIPKMHVDDKTMNVLGQRLDGSRRDELVVQVFADAHPSSFTLYEDDGETIRYRDGAVRETVITQVEDSRGVHVVVQASKGDYTGAPAERATVVEVITRGQPVHEVRVDGNVVPEIHDEANFQAVPTGWYASAGRATVVKVVSRPVTTAKEVQVVFRARR